MEVFWRRLGAWLGAKWWIVLIAALGITGVAAIGLSRIDFATGQDSYLNSGSQIARDNVVYQDRFGGEQVVLLIEMDEGTDVADLFTADNMATFQRLETELRGIPEVGAVLTPLTALQYSEALASSGAGTNALLSAAERDPDPASAALRQADLQVSLARLGAVGEQDLSNPAFVDFLIYGNDGYTLTDGVLSAPADADRVIRPSLKSSFPDATTAVGAAVLIGNASMDELGAGTKSVVAALDGVQLDNATLTVTGAPLFLREINDYLQRGMATLGLAAIAVMAIVLLVLFPRRLRLLPLFTVLVGVLWGFAVLGFLRIDLSLVTISGLPILIGLGIDFAIQMHNRIDEEALLDRSPNPVGEALANLAPAMIAATITGMIAFITLRLSKVPMIRDFGLMLAVGILVVLVTAIVIPSTVLGARAWKRPKSEERRQGLERFVTRLGALPAWTAVPIIGVAVVLFVAGMATESGTEIQSDPIKWADPGSQAVQDIGKLEDRTGFSSTLGVLVQANNVTDDQVTQLLDGFIRDTEARDGVVESDSLVGTMAKVIELPGATPLAPTQADIEAGLAAAPPDVAKLFVTPDLTATQVNLRLAPANLDERARLVESLQADLDRHIAELTPQADATLTEGLASGQPPVKAVPSGLAVVGVGLLDNLSANRALLTYVALAGAALWLVIRHRSLARGLLALVPVVLAIGVSGVLVGVLGVTLSPLTTVSGPLIIATCTEFSVLILARYLEERERRREPLDAKDTAASRAGRAFFTSAMTTIGGFAVLILSPLPLLRDFGIIVTINVFVAVLAALVVMPPAMVWADERGLLAIEAGDRAVRLAARPRGAPLAGFALGVVILLAGVVTLVASADEEPVAAVSPSYTAVALPTTTTEATAAVPEGPVDPSTYGTDRPAGTIAGTLYDVMVGAGVPANQAVCTSEVLLSRTTEADLLAAGIATFAPEALAPVVQAAKDCQVPQERIDTVLASAG